MAEVWAVFMKEWRTEVRSKHGLFTAGLFAVLAVVAMVFAGFGSTPSAGLAAGMLSVTLLFSATIGLPRAYLVEDEQGTFDLLRLIADPGPVFVGKAMFNLAQMLLTSSVLGVLFVAMTGVSVVHPLLFVVGLALQCVSLAAAVSLCGVLVVGATHRWLLAGVVALPLLLPQVFLGVGALAVALGEGSISGGWSSVLGLAGFGLAALAAGPLIASWVWKTEG